MADNSAASCAAPVVVTTEGGGQVVTGTAVDRAGNATPVSVTLSIDKTSPAVTLSQPPDGLYTNALALDVTGSVVDMTPVTVSVNATPASVADTIGSSCCPWPAAGCPTNAGAG